MKKINWVIGVSALSLMLVTGCTVGSVAVQNGDAETVAQTEEGTTDAAGEETLADDFGAVGAIFYGENLTIEEMMTYAIQDEYLARQTYEDIMGEFGEVTPFSNIIDAEVYHIELLTILFDKYGYALPEDTAEAYVVLPRSFEEALAAGVVAEEDNIAMYEVFLAYDLPDDVRDVFEELQAASENHLAAFERSHGGGGGNGYGNNSGN